MEDFFLSEIASLYLFGALQLLRMLFKLYFPQENMRILKVRTILFIWQSVWNRGSIQLVNEEWIAENQQDCFRYVYNAIFLIFNQQRALSESKPHKRNPERGKIVEDVLALNDTALCHEGREGSVMDLYLCAPHSYHVLRRSVFQTWKNSRAWDASWQVLWLTR